jgi:hypothetical protein
MVVSYKPPLLSCPHLKKMLVKIISSRQAGMWEYKGIKYDKIQLLTIQEILEDKKTFNTPTKVGIKGTTGQYSLRI